MQEFTEAAAVVVLFGYAEFLEDKCSIAARDAITAVLALKPESAVVSGSGESPSGLLKFPAVVFAHCSTNHCMLPQEGLSEEVKVISLLLCPCLYKI